MHSAKSVENPKIILYNFSLLKYNADIKPTRLREL